MSRALAIEGEALAVMPYFNDAAIKPAIGRRRIVGPADRERARVFIRRMQRVLGKQVEDVGEQQLLMLLFMVAAELDQRGHGGRQIVLDERGHRAVDMVAIRKDSLERRARDHAASRARLTRAYAFVIRIEQEIELTIVHAVAAQILFEDHPLEEPGGVREMPFRRACVGHRLHGGVGVGERRAETRACLANRLIEPAQLGVILRRTAGSRDTHAILVL